MKYFGATDQEAASQHSTPLDQDGNLKTFLRNAASVSFIDLKRTPKVYLVLLFSSSV